MIGCAGLECGDAEARYDQLVSVIVEPRKEWRCRDCGAAIVRPEILDRIGAGTWASGEVSDDVAAVLQATVPGACDACGSGRARMVISLGEAMRAVLGRGPVRRG
jgi:hypothetical protein